MWGAGKVGCIFTDGGSCKQTAEGLIMLIIGNGLMNFGTVFLDLSLSVKSLVESHIFWPI